MGEREKIAQIIAEHLCPQGKAHKTLYGAERMCYSRNNFADCEKVSECVDALIAANIGDVTAHEAEAEYWKTICKFESDEHHTAIKNAAEHARHLMQERDEWKERAEKEKTEKNKWKCTANDWKQRFESREKQLAELRTTSCEAVIRKDRVISEQKSEIDRLSTERDEYKHRAEVAEGRLEKLKKTDGDLTIEDEIDMLENTVEEARHRSFVFERELVKYKMAFDKAIKLAYKIRTDFDVLSCSSCEFGYAIDVCKKTGLYSDCENRWKEELLQQAQREIEEEKI